MTTLDQFDLALLSALQEDGRLTNQELADRINLSASQCSRRRLRLEAAGIVSGYRAIIDAQAVGLGIVAFVQVTLTAHTKTNAESFKGLVRERPEILTAYTLTGDADYLLQVVTADLGALSRFISEVLLPHGTVARVESRIVLDRLKEDGALPLKQVD